MASTHDPELRGPDQLTPPRVPVVRLNRRVLYVAGSVLVVAVVAGLVALRAQGSRLEQDASSPRAARLTDRAGERWFDKIPDLEPSVQPAGATPPAAGPSPLLRPLAESRAATLSDADLQAQRRERALLAAMAVWKQFSSRNGPRILMIALAVFHAADCLRLAPDYLSYFTPVVDSAKSYRLLTDSNTDWGQGLIALRKYQDHHQGETIHLAYFGTVDPAVYGIKAVPMAATPVHPSCRSSSSKS